MFRTSFLFVVCVSLVASAAAPKASRRDLDRDALRKALQSVMQNTPLATARVTCQVRSLDDGTVVFGRDSDELLNPASNVKLYTSATALSRLGTEYRFETEFLTDGELKEGKTKTLYVRGKGDPTITTERLYGIVSDLVHAGLKEVGDIVLDDTWFDDNRVPPGYDQESGDKAYLAPTGALSLNWNTVGVYLRPGDSIGSKASVELEPASDFFTLDDNVTTGTKTQRRYMVSSQVDKDHVRQHIEAKGVVPLDKGAWSAWKKVDQPALYFGYTLKSFLLARGVKVKGRLRLDKVPAVGPKTISIAQSDTLDLVLKKLNKLSQNFIAEQLIKTLGAEGKGAPGTTAKGIEVVEDFLAKDIGIPRGTYVMKNGSGLNDTNRFSSAQTTKLLLAMWAKFPTMPEYLSALGIAGKDGTLRFRFEGSDAVGRLRAKTGTLESVSALSGYVQSVGGERFVFSVMVNDFPGRASSVVQHIDALGAAVAATGSEHGPSAAVASMTQPPQVVGSASELLARMKTYAALAQKSDVKNAPFLRTAWRNEKDPAVRAVIADALYQSDPHEPTAALMLLDSALPGDEVYARVRAAAKEAKLNPPLLGSLVELASAGSVDASTRLIQFVQASAADELVSELLAEQLAVVAHDAPKELVLALRASPPETRELAIDALVKGLVKAAQPDSPLWSALKESLGSQDPKLVEFSKDLEVTLSQKIALAHAPATTAPTPEPQPTPPDATQKPPAVPGG